MPDAASAAAPASRAPRGRRPPTATIIDPRDGTTTTIVLARGGAACAGDEPGGGARFLARLGGGGGGDDGGAHGASPAPPRDVLLRAPAALLDDARLDAPCPVCGCRHLYAQRDLNRTLGVSFVGFAAVGGLVWSALQGTIWPLFGCLVGASLLDVAIHAMLPTVVACYRCLTVFRDARPGDGVGEYDQAVADGYAYSQNVLGSGYDHPAAP